jgi:hypothetical protein
LVFSQIRCTNLLHISQVSDRVVPCSEDKSSRDTAHGIFAIGKTTSRGVNALLPSMTSSARFAACDHWPIKFYNH